MRAIGLFLCLIIPALSQQFSKSVYPALETATCRSCHNHEGVASATRLQFPDEDASPEKIEAFGRSLVALVDRANPANSLLVRKPTGRVAHAGGQRLKQGSKEDTLLQQYAAQLARMTPQEVAAALKYREDEASGIGYAAHKVALRRLTHSQYNKVVRDLLGDTSQPANQFPPEDFINGFKTQYQAQSISPLLMESYSAAAERLARNAFRAGDSHKLIPCTIAKADAACRARFVEDFGRNAFRRPLNPVESKRYLTLLNREKDLLAGAQLVVEAMLQSPNFLFRMDDVGDPALKPWAAAGRLSFALWDSMPDAALFNAAAKGELNSPDALRQQAIRLISDPRARDTIDEFTAQWLRFDRVLGTARDRRQFPKFNRETAVAMTGEARQFISDLVWNDRDFMELFSGDQGFLTPDLAGIYDMTAPAREYEPVKFPSNSDRGGIIGQALFLTLTAKPDDTSPTARGLFVREQFLCQHVAPPPAGVNTNLPPVSEARPLNNRQRLGEHVSNPSCAACHNLIDPIGFGLEKFDAIGVKREKATLVIPQPHGGDEKKPKRVEVDLDTSGFVAGIPNSSFSTPKELGMILARTPVCQECIVKQFFRFTVGRMENQADRPLIDTVTADFRGSRFKFKELMISLVVNRELPKPREGATSAARYNPPR